MWYKVSKIILADIQGAITKLQESGISQGVIDFINSFPDDQTKGRLIGALNRNPSLTIDDLRTQILEKRQYQPTDFEKIAVSNFETEDFKRWMLFVFKNKRTTSDDNGRSFRYDIQNMEEFISDSEHIEDFYIAYKRDNPSYQLGNLSWEEAKIASDDWHEASFKKGTGKFYEPYERDEEGNLIDRRIVKIYPDGWKMVKVISENDLEVEHQLMHHCVNTYDYKVRNGISKIYSLRDQNNKPHVTIEVSSDGTVKQIKGYNNAKVEDEELVKKIKEFFDEEDSIDRTAGGEKLRDYYLNQYEIYWGTYPDELKSSISESIYLSLIHI